MSHMEKKNYDFGGIKLSKIDEFWVSRGLVPEVCFTTPKEQNIVIIECLGLGEI